MIPSFPPAAGGACQLPLSAESLSSICRRLKRDSSPKVTPSSWSSCMQLLLMWGYKSPALGQLWGPFPVQSSRRLTGPWLQGCSSTSPSARSHGCHFPMRLGTREFPSNPLACRKPASQGTGLWHHPMGEDGRRNNPMLHYKYPRDRSREPKELQRLPGGGEDQAEFWTIGRIQILLFGHKKKWSTDACYTTDESWKIMLSKRSQPQKTPCAIPSVWNDQNREIYGERK